MANDNKQTIAVRVRPRSSSDQIVEWIPENLTLTVRVKTPPVENAANEATIRLIAKTIRVPRSKVRILRGARSRDKVIEIDADPRTLSRLKTD